MFVYNNNTLKLYYDVLLSNIQISGIVFVGIVCYALLYYNEIRSRVSISVSVSYEQLQTYVNVMMFKFKYSILSYL